MFYGTYKLMMDRYVSHFPPPSNASDSAGDAQEPSQPRSSEQQKLGAASPTPQLSVEDDRERQNDPKAA